MNTSFWRRWCTSVVRARPTSPSSRAKPRRTCLGLEALEDRVTPSLTPQMVLDIKPGFGSPNGSFPSEIVAIGSTAYFTAWDGTHGQELWKSNGTADGTVLVKDVRPGSLSGVGLSSSPYNLTNVN